VSRRWYSTRQDVLSLDLSTVAEGLSKLPKLLSSFVCTLCCSESRPTPVLEGSDSGMSEVEVTLAVTRSQVQNYNLLTDSKAGVAVDSCEELFTKSPSMVSPPSS
jgi:hypothetical protein